MVPAKATATAAAKVATVKRVKSIPSSPKAVTVAKKIAAAPKKLIATTKVKKPAVKKIVNTTDKPSASSSTVFNKEKIKKSKLVRDSFTMPESEYVVLGDVKRACINAGVEVKKSQLLRIGIYLLSKTDVKSLKSLIAGLAPLKAGRPKNEK